MSVVEEGSDRADINRATPKQSDIDDLERNQSIISDREKAVASQMSQKQPGSIKSVDESPELKGGVDMSEQEIEPTEKQTGLPDSKLSLNEAKEVNQDDRDQIEKKMEDEHASKTHGGDFARGSDL